MTAYTVSGSVTPGAPGTGSYIIVRAAVFQMRVAQISVDSSYGYIYRISGAGQSGGSAITPIAMREGSPASSNSAWQNSSSVTGTSTYIGTTFQPPFSMILNPGSAVAVYGYNGTGVGGGAGTITATFYWEELRLSWSY